MMQSYPKKRTRDAEIALIAQISTSLDTYKETPNPQTVARLQKDFSSKNKKKKPSPSSSSSYLARNNNSALSSYYVATTTTTTTTTNATTNNFLVVKTLVKGIVKACVKEQLTIEHENKSVVGVVDSLIEEYRFKYPTLTKQMIANAMERYRKTQAAAAMEASGGTAASKPSGGGGGAESTTEEGGGGGDAKIKEEDGNAGVTLERCIVIVDDEIAEYYEKIEALRRKRELAASQPESKPETTPRHKRRKRRKSAEGGGEGNVDGLEDANNNNAAADNNNNNNDNNNNNNEPPAPRPRGRPRKNTPETALIKEITERYARERQGSDRLPNGAFETIVEEAKKDFSMEDFDLSLDKIRKRVTWNFMHRRDDGGDTIARKKKTDVFEEVYRRYSRAKVSNEGKLPPGTLVGLIDAVKLEHGVADVKMSTLEAKVRTRFKKENPGFRSAPPPSSSGGGGASSSSSSWDAGKLSEEEKRNRDILVNEITNRYIRRKEEVGGGSYAPHSKLPDGELDRIIEDTKNDLGMYDFDIPKATIRARVVDHHRKSSSSSFPAPAAVTTFGQESNSSPYDIIDEPLVATINTWLSQGVSVTRAQGLEFANTLLKGTRTGASERMEDEENEVFLDAKWWRNFLDRNKRKLVCSSD